MVRERNSDDTGSSSELSSDGADEGWPEVWGERRRADQGVDVPAMGSLPVSGVGWEFG